ncbi:MAG: MATE family efflux transporter [Synergistaceae bacterium]|jgi:putative MATE family efflux protein|nr:MATE family efflux transporter [Synergistaceae bacterium]
MGKILEKQRAKFMNGKTDSKYDLTNGPILDKLLLVALPIIGTQLLMMSYNFVDMFLLGRVGSDAVASAGLAGMYVWMSEGFLLVGKMGAEIGVSQNLGRRETEAARKFSLNSIFLALLIGIFFTISAEAFSDRLIGFFRVQEANVASDARVYLVIVALSAPALFVSAAISGIFTGAGNSRVPFAINASGLALNVVLDLIFIFGLGMGVKGAAVATAISQAAACGILLAALVLKKGVPFDRFVFLEKPDGKVIVQILRWSVPLAVVSVLFTFFTMFINRLAAGFGAGVIAVYRVGTHIESLTWLTGEGMATSVAAFAGQNYGAMKLNRIKEGVKIALISWCLWGAAVMALLIIAGRTLFAFFLPDPALIDMGGTYLRILAMCEVFGCLEAISFGAMRGLGKPIPQFVASIGCNALRIPISYALAYFFGVNGIWMGISITASMRGFFGYIWFRRVMKNLR